MPIPIAIDYRPALLSGAGIGRAVRELARALAAHADLDVHLFGHSLARCRHRVAVGDGITLHRLPIAGRALPAIARLGLGADRLAGRVAVFHWTDFVQPPVTRARTVFTVHDLAFVRDPSWHGADAAVLRERTRSAIARADVIVVPSMATARDVRAFAPDGPAPHVVPFGADHVPAHDASCAPDPSDHVLCIGTIEPRKNHRTLIAAWRLLPAPRPRLVVIGRIGWACGEIVNDLRAAAAEGLLTWRPDASDAEMFALLRGARALVYPSSWEGFGFPPLEAMRTGVPVVAGDTAALRELGDEAMVFAPPGDAAALADAIGRVMRDGELRQRLCRAGRARAADFTWRRCAEAHAAVYREVAR